MVLTGPGQEEFEAKLLRHEQNKEWRRVRRGTGKLEDKVAVVTGAGGGQGEIEAKVLAWQGAKVVLMDIDEDGIKRVRDKIIEWGGEAISVQGDVGSEESWKHVVEKAIAAYGKINILVNNAGVLSSGSVITTTMEDFNRVMNIDCYGVLYGMRHCAPEMIKAGGGAIVNTSSISGCRYGQANFVGYATAKAAVLGMSRQAACDLAQYGIRVNTIHPGHVLTSMTAKRPANRLKLAEAALMKRYAMSEELALPVLFLVSDDSAFITAQDLYVDGGMSACLNTNNTLYSR